MKRPTKYRSCEPEDDKFIVNNYEKLTSGQIAQALGKTSSVVRARISYLNLNGSFDRQYAAITEEQKQAIQKMIDKGYRIRAIRNEVCINERVLSAYLRTTNYQFARCSNEPSVPTIRELLVSHLSPFIWQAPKFNATKYKKLIRLGMVG